MQRAELLHHILQKAFPDAKSELHFATPFQFLVAIILSAQATDVGVNRVTPALFETYPTPKALAQADIITVESLIGSIGLFRAKAKSIVGMASMLVENYGGEIPLELKELVKLPGVGRKTANVFLGGAYQINSGIAVDTHVGRVARRLGLTAEMNPDKVEQDLMAQIPESEWHRVNTVWVLHGRYVCTARKPKCASCVLQTSCPRVGV